METLVESTYDQKGRLQQERMAGPGEGGMVHQFKYDGEDRVILEEWLDLEGAPEEKMTYKYSRDGKRSDSKVYRGGSAEEPYAEGFETMNEDGLPLEASLKEKDGPSYQWFYHYKK